jgi:Thermostable hemolysin
MLAQTTTALPARLSGGNEAPTQPRWHFGAVNGETRKDAERFIAAGFLKAYGARLTEFMPELMGLYHDDALVAACGLRPAENGTLFLEQYLDHSVDIALNRATGMTADRKKIIEVGNLSVSRAGYARHFVAWLTRHLHDSGMQWALFSAVPALRNNFLRLGIPMITLAPADPGRLSGNARANWGTYYDQQPQVTAVHVATAFATLAGN